MSQQTITLPADAERAERIKGQHLTVLACDAPFLVELDKGGRHVMDAGATLSGPFARLTFKETSGADNNITFVAGKDAYKGLSQVTSIASRPASQATFNIVWEEMPVGGNLLTVGASDGDKKLIPATVTIGDYTYQRIAFHVANTGSDLRIQICESDLSIGKTFDLVMTNQDRTLESREKVYVRGDASQATIAVYLICLSTPIA